MFRSIYQCANKSLFTIAFRIMQTCSKSKSCALRFLLLGQRLKKIRKMNTESELLCATHTVTGKQNGLICKGKSSYVITLNQRFSTRGPWGGSRLVKDRKMETHARVDTKVWEACSTCPQLMATCPQNILYILHYCLFLRIFFFYAWNVPYVFATIFVLRHILQNILQILQ